MTDWRSTPTATGSGSPTPSRRCTSARCVPTSTRCTSRSATARSPSRTRSTTASEELRFFSDDLLGDDPETVKDGLRAGLRRLLERDFRHVLFAHGDPIVGDGRERLERFASR